MTELAIKIHALRQLGKTYLEICSELNCSKGTVCYYLGVGQKNKTYKRQKLNRCIQHPMIRKIEYFCNPGSLYCHPTKIKKMTYQRILNYKITMFHTNHKKGKNRMYNPPTFTIDDVIAKFGQQTICYLTGLPIDITQPKTYQLDHIIPYSRGGDNSLDNLGLCSKAANQAKHDMTPDEFINLCKLVLQHHGYQVNKSGANEN